MGRLRKFDVQLVAAVNVYPADERANDHLFRLDAKIATPAPSARDLSTTLPEF